MVKRTAEIIMVLKGNSNLDIDAPTMGELNDKYSTKSEITDNEYFYLVALYMSDDCFVPISYYYKNPHVIESVIHEVAIDYIKTCDNPGYFLHEYFANKNSERHKSDIGYWCSTFDEQQVREHDRYKNLYYINGFTEENTQNYERQRPYFEDFKE